MAVHYWGDEWFEKYGDDLFVAGNYIDTVYNNKTGKHLMWKEKYGSIRYEFIGSIGVTTKEDLEALHNCIADAAEKFPHLEEEILGDSPFEDQYDPYWDKIN